MDHEWKLSKDRLSVDYHGAPYDHGYSYSVDLPELSRDFDKWIAHLKTKNWFFEADVATLKKFVQEFEHGQKTTGT